MWSLNPIDSKKLKFIFFILFFVSHFIAGCKDKKSAESVEIVMPEVIEDFQMPSRIWDEILGIATPVHSANNSHDEKNKGSADEHGGGGEHGGGAKKTAEPLITFNKIKVILTEKNPKVLNEKSYSFEFPRGGGFIDLAKYVSDQNGSFYIHFQLPEEDKPDQTKAFFISKSKKRKVENEIWGSGCKTAMEISTFYKKVISQGKFEVNTTRDRHLSLLGGHFILSVNDGKQIKVTQVTFYDSRRLDLMCDNKEPHD